MSEANKALARRLWDVWHSRNLDKLGDLIAEGHVNHDPNNPADLVGVKGYRELITLYTTMFSDLRFEIHDIVAEGNIVCSRWTSVGTHDGEVLGITPTGNLLKRTGVSWQRIEHGTIKPWLRRMRPYREATYSGVRVSYKSHLDGGGSTFGQDFIPLLRERGMPKVQRAFEWCTGPGFIGFSLLAHGLTETLCLADVNPEAVAACRRTVARNGLERSVAV